MWEDVPKWCPDDAQMVTKVSPKARCNCILLWDTTWSPSSHHMGTICTPVVPKLCEDVPELWPDDAQIVAKLSPTARCNCICSGAPFGHHLVITRAPFGWWGEQGGTERVGSGVASKGSGKCGQEIGEGGGLVAGWGYGGSGCGAARGSVGWRSGRVGGGLARASPLTLSNPRPPYHRPAYGEQAVLLPFGWGRGWDGGE